MAITDFPVQDETSLGQAKVDAGAYVDPNTQVKSLFWNTVVTRLISLFTAVGLDNGTTVGSLRRGLLPTLIQLSGKITPAAISSQADDYAPAGYADATVWRISSTNPGQSLTGLAGGVDGLVRVLDNVGSYPILLKVLTGSAAGNQFAASPDGADIYLHAGQRYLVQYDLTSTKWRVIGVQKSGSTTFAGLMSAADKSKLDAIEALADVTDATNVAAAGAVMDGDFTVSGRMIRTGAGTYNTIVDNYGAATAPTVNDDIDLGYTVGSFWWDLTNDKFYTCLDNTNGAAVWKGSGGIAVATRSEGQTLKLDKVNLIDTAGASGGTFNVLLPAMTGDGVLYVRKKANPPNPETITITPAGGDSVEPSSNTLHGSASQAIDPAPGWMLVYQDSSSTWFVIAMNHGHDPWFDASASTTYAVTREDVDRGLYIDLGTSGPPTFQINLPSLSDIVRGFSIPVVFKGADYDTEVTIHSTTADAINGAFADYVIDPLLLGSEEVSFRLELGLNGWRFHSSRVLTVPYFADDTFALQAGMRIVGATMRPGAGGGGAGASGGGGHTADPGGGGAGGEGGGGGGGASSVYVELSQTPGPLTITIDVGAGGTGGTAPSAAAAGADGANGGDGTDGAFTRISCSEFDVRAARDKTLGGGAGIGGGGGLKGVVGAGGLAQPGRARPGAQYAYGAGATSSELPGAGGASSAGGGNATAIATITTHALFGANDRNGAAAGTGGAASGTKGGGGGGSPGGSGGEGDERKMGWANGPGGEDEAVAADGHGGAGGNGGSNSAGSVGGAAAAGLNGRGGGGGGGSGGGSANAAGSAAGAPTSGQGGAAGLVLLHVALS